MSSSSLEEKALLSLVQSYEGRAWATSLNGWSANSGIPVCEWKGVTCRVNMDGGPAVVAEVSLPSAGLSGTVPTELGLLTELEHLTLKNNILQGSIPQEVANLQKLTTLDLTECFLTGTLPQRFESPNLKTLLLANNAISGRFFETDDSPHLQNINEIRMENNLLTGTLHGPSLIRMPHLETLSLSDNDLSGLIPGEELGALPALHYLYLDTNHFVGPLPSQLAQIGKAQILELWVQDNAISGTVPASYVRFDRIHDFFIDGNKLTGALPPDLCGPEINADFFANVPSEAERNYCDSIACPAGSVAFEGVYPCEKCSGGEAARLKNRYLGQTGKCSDFDQRDILKIFHDATTKAGPWSGVSDWDDETKNVCDMTGVTCDAHSNVVEIMLKNRRLEGHIPDEIGFLSFLESLDLSDNALMGYVPSDLQWTSLKRFDISGNKIHGMIPPLLCMMEELNGNGADNVFYCDRIACPEGTFNTYGFHHGAHGETCQPCYDDSPYIAQKACTHTQKPGGPHFFEMAKETSEEMGVMPKVAFGMGIGLLLIALALFSYWKYQDANQRKKYEQGNKNGNERGKKNKNVRGNKNKNEWGNENGVLARQDQTYSYNDEEEDEHVAAYSFRDDTLLDVPDNPRYDPSAYKDFVISDDHMDEENNMEEYDAPADYDDDNMSRATSTSRRSATDLVSEHQGMTLNRRDKFKKAVSERMPGDISRRAREAASSINVGARRMTSRRSSFEGKGYDDYDNGYDDERFEADMELVKNSSSTSETSGDASSIGKGAHKKKQVQQSDLLDIPMIT